MGISYPALLLLGLPLGWIWWRTRTTHLANDATRLLGALCLLIALTGPYLLTSTSGRDLVFVIDRSLSMPQGSTQEVLDLLRLAESERRSGDRVGIVTFGREPRIERLPSDQAIFQNFEQIVDRDGSDLAEAIELALNLIPEQREGAILCLSDGESTGIDALSSARRAFGRGIRIDVRDFTRQEQSDLSIDSLELPGQVAVGEPFQFNVWVRADRRVETDFTLRRGDRVLSSGRRVFEAGANRLVFRDILGQGGVREYEVELGSENDRIPENNRGLGAVRVRNSPALLVLNHDGAEDALTQALRGAGLPLVVSTPETTRLDAVGLSAFRAVILENVAFSRIAHGGLALQNFVLHHGGGLLLTGGNASFGVGGYYLSPLDEILPVSMEMRQEHRKLSVAMAVTLDRSGSMGVPVAGGMLKMDLANLGTVAAIELLSPQDSVAVIAVDSAPHVVQPLVDVSATSDILARVRRIQSGGGGIFVRTALLAAGRELEHARQLNKHIILFADAADSEEQEQCPAIIAELRKSGVTLSVIALGTELDSDAEFLKRCAAQGAGEIYFTTDPADLPRLFALDTMTAARSTFINEPTGVQVLPGLFGLTTLTTESLPTLGGYNLTYLRSEGAAGMATRDEYQAPIFAFRQSGLGRVAIFAGQIGGTYGSSILAWPEFGSFFTTAARWLLGNEEPEEFFANVRREGSQVVVSVEVDSHAAVPPDTSEMRAILEDQAGKRQELVLARTEENYFEARYALEQDGVLLGTVAIDSERFLQLPPIALPYSPEFERRPDPESGRRALNALARESGGQVGASAGSFFRGERKSRLWRLISREFLLAGLILLLVEIAARRLSLWFLPRLPSGLRERWSKTIARAAALFPARRTATSTPASEPSLPSPVGEQADPGITPAVAEEKPAAGIPQAGPSLGSALEKARRSADRKLSR